MQDFRNLRIKLVFGLCAALVYAGQRGPRNGYCTWVRHFIAA